MTQKEFGMKIGFSASTADSRIRKYEGDVMAPKSEIKNKLVQALDVDPSTLSNIDIHSIEDVVRIFFFMEEYLDFKIENIDLDNYIFDKEYVLTVLYLILTPNTELFLAFQCYILRFLIVP